MAIFVRAVRQRQRYLAKAIFGLATVRVAHTGSFTTRQRFSSALGLNLHLHSLFLDGVVTGGG